MAADTSSPAAAAIAVVDGAAAAAASSIASPIPVRSTDAMATASGAAITYDDNGGSHPWWRDSYRMAPSGAGQQLFLADFQPRATREPFEADAQFVGDEQS